MRNYISIHTTVPLTMDLTPLIQYLLSNKLAACIQVTPPVSSTFIWNNGIDTLSEHQVIIKTTKSNYASVQAALVDAHPYDVPQIYATEWTNILPAYKDWMDEQLT